MILLLLFSFELMEGVLVGTGIDKSRGIESLRYISTMVAKGRTQAPRDMACTSRPGSKPEGIKVFLSTLSSKRLVRDRPPESVVVLASGVVCRPAMTMETSSGEGRALEELQLSGDEVEEEEEEEDEGIEEDEDEDEDEGMI